MSDDEFRYLFKSLGSQILEKNVEKNDILRILIRETLKFRDKLKEDTGEVLTIEDTQKALGALEKHINGQKFPRELSPVQKALAQIIIDRVILFKLQ